MPIAETAVRVLAFERDHEHCQAIGLYPIGQKETAAEALGYWRFYFGQSEAFHRGSLLMSLLRR